jgi:ferrochelatase
MRTAVVIYNLGGPDRLESVRKFLFNLFNDPLIIRRPTLLRWLLAKLISWRRAPVAKAIYAQIGGRSPILDETKKQRDALQRTLNDSADNEEYGVFIAMRYWDPFVEECIAEVQEFGPDRIVLLPLYPQFSTTTTESFLRVWRKTASDAGINQPTAEICCYPAEPGFIGSIADLTRQVLDTRKPADPIRVLFSAHGIPEQFVGDGDPYQRQIEKTVAAIVGKLAIDGLDYVICYQSRVGPVEWLRPYTDDEIRRAGRDGIGLVVVPVAFVSEHSETLVELDIEYGEVARSAGVPSYHRVPTVGVGSDFISGLAGMVREFAGKSGVSPGGGVKICPSDCRACPA